MKKIFFEKAVALILILIAGGVTYFLYQQGEISFLPKKKEKQEIKTMVAEILISESQYQLSYKEKTDAAFNIANFENNENWFGDGDFDFSTYFEGEASLFLSSINHQKASVNLKKYFNFKDVLNFKFLVHLSTDPAYIEEFNLIFSGENNEYKFPIRDLTNGWNLFVLSKESFSSLFENKISEGVVPEIQVEKVTIELTSRPNVRSIVHLDALWAEKEKDYLKDWNLNSEKFLALKKNGDTFGLLAINLTDNRATLRNGSGKDYTFQAKFIPLNTGAFGFFLRGDYRSGYGYYLLMNGAETDSWQIYKYGPVEEKDLVINLAKGEIKNLNLVKNKTYWLKADLKGHRIVFYFSQDGNKFTKLGEVNDDSFSSGGVGIAVYGRNMVLIDDLQFFQ